MEKHEAQATEIDLKLFRVTYTIHSFVFGIDLPFFKNIHGQTASEAEAVLHATNGIAENIKSVEIDKYTGQPVQR